MQDHSSEKSDLFGEPLRPPTKTCKRCFKAKLFSEFRKCLKHGRRIVDSHCKSCRCEVQREWRKNLPLEEKKARYRKQNIKGLYGMTLGAYETMLESQGGVCAICKNKCRQYANLAIDHSHDNGKIRGLLCSSCNNGIGRFKESPLLLRAAAEYLERFK